MSNAKRKARKAAGQPFVPKPQKVPTPVHQRANVQHAANLEVRRIIRKLKEMGVRERDMTPEAIAEAFNKEQESK
jgi:hypothetical protein